MLLDAHKALERGFIYQERKANRLFPLATSPEDPVALRQGYLDWLLTGRYTIGIGHPRRALRVGRTAP
jgi:phage major head subunit gpT-like protein